MAEEYFRTCGQVIIDKLHSDSVLTGLWSQKIITGREMDDIGDLSSYKNREILVNILKLKDPAVISKFVQIVKTCTTGQEDMIQILESALDLLPCSIKHHDDTSTSCSNAGVCFGMSDLIHNFTGRRNDLDKLHKLVTENCCSSPGSCYALLTSVKGIGGVGKTCLAKKYAIQQREFFDGNLIWIDSENVETLRHSFITLAKTIGVRVKDSLGEPFEIAVVVQNIYKFFHGRNVLMIFDNASEFSGDDGIESFLPSGLENNIFTLSSSTSPTTTTKRPYFLITSRKNIITNGRTLQLDVLDIEDSISLVKSVLKNASYRAAKSLSLKLERLPLAIKQALAYIDNYKDIMYSNEDSAILGYISEYDSNSNESKMRLLNHDKFVKDGDDKYKHTVYTTWKTILPKVGPFSGLVLSFLAYFSPENISINFFSNLHFKLAINGMVGHSKQEIFDAIVLLSNFSMIHVKSGIIKIHRLVQEVVRLDIDESQEIELVGNIIELIETNRRNDSEHGVQVILHGEAILQHLERHENHFEKFSKFLMNTKRDCEALSMIRHELPDSNDTDAAKLIWSLERKIEIIKLAVAYVKCVTTVSIENYLKLHRERVEGYLRMKPTDVEFVLTSILASWMLTKEQIQQGKNSFVARLLVQCIPYLDVENLSLEDLKIFTALKIQHITDASALLEKFAIVKLERDKLQMDNLLYQALKSEALRNISLRIVSDFIHKIISEKCKVRSHALAVFPFYIKENDVVKDFPQFPIYLMSILVTLNDHLSLNMVAETSRTKFTEIFGAASKYEMEINELISKLSRTSFDYVFQIKQFNFRVTAGMLMKLSEILENTKAFTHLDEIPGFMLTMDDRFRNRLRPSRDTMFNTLYAWISENGSEATFGNLLEIFNDANLFSVTEILKSNAEEIFLSG